MAIPKIKEQDIIAALKYIDENGVPFHNQSTKYELVTEDGRKYPPKYVVAVARHLASGEEIVISDFSAVEAKNYLQGQGYVAPGHEFQDIYVEWRVFFWDDGLTENYLNVTLYRDDIIAFRDFLEDVRKTGN